MTFPAWVNAKRLKVEIPSIHGERVDIRDASCPPIARFQTEKKKRDGAREVKIDQLMYAV